MLHNHLWLLKKYDLSISKLGEGILRLHNPPSTEEASQLLRLLHQQSNGFTQATVLIHQAAAQCLQWGAELPRKTAQDIALFPLHAVDSHSQIKHAFQQLQSLQNNFFFLFHDGNWDGIVSSRDIRQAMHHGLGDQSILSISLGQPQTVNSQQTIESVRQLFQNPLTQAVLVMQGHQCIGFIDRYAALGTTLPKHLTPDWGSAFAEQETWLYRTGHAAAEVNSKAYLVGGSVRDLLLQRTVKDLDFTIVGDAIAVGKYLHLHYGGKLHLDNMFGAAHWTSPDGETIDLTTSRTEYYAKRGSLPAVFSSHLQEDFFRRDFTINMMAICVNPNHWGELIDPFCGCQALLRKHIQIVHGLSFLDDPTRIVRAARYAGRLGFTLEENTKRLLTHALSIGAGNDLTQERLGRELQHLFTESNAAACWHKLIEWGAVESWFSGFQERWPWQEVKHNHSLLQKLYPNLPTVDKTLWFSLSAGLPEKQRKALQKLPKSQPGLHKLWLQAGQELDKISQRLESSTCPEEWGLHLQKTQPELWPCLMAQNDQSKRAVLWWVEYGQKQKTTITGKQLLTLGHPRGPKIGQALQRAQLAAWRGETAEQQLQAAVTIWQESLHKK